MALFWDISALPQADVEILWQGEHTSAAAAAKDRKNNHTSQTAQPFHTHTAEQCSALAEAHRNSKGDGGERQTKLGQWLPSSMAKKGPDWLA